MDNLTPTIEFVAQCIGCLSDDISGVSSNSKLAEIYEDLIQEQITEKLNENSYIFCINCETNLRSFNNFKKICKKSWKQLAQHFTEEWACELEQLLADSPLHMIPEDVVCDKRENNSCLVEDEIYYISDSEASTLPPDEEESNKILEPEKLIKANNKILFVSVENVPETKTNGHADQRLSENKVKIQKISDQIIDSSGPLPAITRERLVFLGLLPKSTNNNLTVCHVCHISIRDIQSHYITAHTTVELDRYICSGCTIVHKTQEQIIKHIKTYHTLYLKPRKCTFCDDTFIESGDYRRHVVGHQREINKFVCNICGKKESRRSNLKFHVMRIHIGNLYCKYCYKAFVSKEEFETHMKLEEEKKAARGSYICDICGYKTQYKQRLGLHIQNLHKLRTTKEFSCHICCKKFSSSESLRHHVKFIHKKKHKCSVCDKTFGFLKDMRYHYQVDHTHDGMRESCDICGKFISKKAMPLHKNTIHSNARPFQCNVCDKAFKQKVLLKTHMYKHTGFRPYFCNEEGCNRGFYDSPVLIRHFLREHGKTVTHEDIKRDCKRKVTENKF